MLFITKVTGAVLDKTGAVRYVLNGTWDDSMEYAPVLNANQTRNGKPVLETGPARLLWQKNPMYSSDAERMYYFNQFAIQLNEMEQGICPTDCRFRPDQRLMEVGQWDEANRSKVSLEEMQRQRRRQMASDLAVQSLNQDQKIFAESGGSSNADYEDEFFASRLSPSYINSFRKF